MSRRGYLQLVLLSLVTVVVFAALSLGALTWYSRAEATRHRDEFLGFLASQIERALGGVSDLRNTAGVRHALQTMPPPMHGGPPGGSFHGGPAPLPPDMPPGPPPERAGHGGPGPGRPNLWLVNEAGEVVYSERDSPLPKPWGELRHPQGTHETSVDDGRFLPGPEIAIVRLEYQPALYLVVQSSHQMNLGPLFFIQAVMTIGSCLFALLVSVSAMLYYLRRKSSEARKVLNRLEQGDLKARFQVGRFDQSSGLLLDFNRMADSIEHLVERVHTTETTRKNLLQELGHDVRTPLTSLATSFETLKLHSQKMSESERADLFEMMTAEVEYLRELLEKLMTIASLNEPGYKKSTQAVPLYEALLHEIEQRRSSERKGIQWNLAPGGENVQVLGDPHLLQRMIRNAFDNAARFAKREVVVEIKSQNGQARITVCDDGPGFSAEALESFGKRQEKRTKRDTDKLNFSLGLGSVIMKAIAELHSGTVQIENARGAQVSFHLPALS